MWRPKVKTLINLHIFTNMYQFFILFSYDIVNPFERRYNGNYYQLPRQSPSNYYLPVVPPVSIGRWVPDTSIRYFPINRVYWNPGYPYVSNNICQTYL